MRGQEGVSLVETLIGILIVVIASIGTLAYFSSALGNVGRQSNRRAALERARERLEQLMAVDVNTIKPAIVITSPPTPNAQPVRWVSCTGATCGPALSSDPDNKVDVDDLANQPLASTIQWRDDPSAGTTGVPDVLELGVKVWLLPGPDDNFH